MVFHDSGINVNFYQGVMVMGALEALPTQACLETAPLIHLLPLAPVLWSQPGSSGLIPDVRTSVVWESWDLWPGLLGMMNSSLLQPLGWELEL